MPGGLDHVVIAARDLEGLADFYRRLGFQVGTRNRHSWGTLNHIVQFDGCFLELLTTEPGFTNSPQEAPEAPFANFINGYLSAGHEGAAMIVIESTDAEADQSRFAAAGIAAPATLHFGRKGRLPGGDEVDVAFTLAFARISDIKNAGFFVCQQHAPEMFWRADFQVHDNGVENLSHVVFAAPEPARHTAFFENYLGVPARVRDQNSVTFPTKRGAVELLTSDTLLSRWNVPQVDGDDPTPRVAALVFKVANISTVVGRLSENSVPFTEAAGDVIVTAKQAQGVSLIFRAA